MMYLNIWTVMCQISFMQSFMQIPTPVQREDFTDFTFLLTMEKKPA